MARCRKFPRAFARRWLAAGAAIALLSVWLAPASGHAASSVRAHRAAETQALLRSRVLWATIDVCSPSDEPNTVGIRGSMPGDGQAHDAMFMRFRLQYENMTTKRWTDLTSASTTSFASVGSGASARQAGRSFKLSPVAGQPAFTLRGVVVFQWRSGHNVLAQASRVTTAGRKSLAGSNPAGFSSATCLIG